MSKRKSKPLVTVGTKGTAPSEAERSSAGQKRNAVPTTKAATGAGVAPANPTSGCELAYAPTDRERAVLDARQKRRLAKAPSPRLAITSSKGTHQVGPDHADAAVGNSLLMEAIGTDNADFLHGLVSQLVNAGSKGQQPDERGINFMLAVVKGIAPRDEVEAMLAAQMAAIHMASMTFVRRLNHVETLAQQDSAERALNKLTRTFASQVEALKRYRTGGEQKVTVEHVHVHAGGQAIVGHVQHGGGEEPEK